jgi:hypothetical protein
MPVGSSTRAAATSPRTASPVQQLYLWYLLLIPQGATVAAVATFHGPLAGPLPFIYFLGGFIAVAIYAAVIAMYVDMPRVWWRALLAVGDGPIVIAIAGLTLHGWRILDLAAWFFLSESLSIYLAIAVLAVGPGGPTGSQRQASLGIMAISVGAVCLMLGGTTFPELAADWRGAVEFTVGLVMSTIVGCLALGNQPVRTSDQAQGPLLGSLGLFAVAVGGGVLLRLYG